GNRVGAAAECRKVVVLDEQAVEEANAVVVASALSDRILFEQSPAGRGLARVEDAGRAAGCGRFDVAACERRDTPQSLQEVGGGPVGGEAGPHRAGLRGQPTP